jgi:hypothetical protein
MIFSTASRPIWGSLRLIASEHRNPFYRAVTRPEREADHSLPSSAEVKKAGGIPRLLHTASWPRAYQFEPEVYLDSSIRLLGLELTNLSTGTTVLFLLYILKTNIGIVPPGYSVLGILVLFV